MTRAAIHRLACSALLLGAGCSAVNANSGKSFDPEWQNDSGRSIAELEQRLRSLPPVPNARVAVGLDDRGLVAVALDGSAHWAHPASPRSAPLIAGNLVIYADGSHVIALDARTGAERWSIANEGLALRGAANDGQVSALVLADAHGSQLWAISSTGSRLASARTEADLGPPAARGGVAFVPWNHEYVSALDLQSGAEVARLLARMQVSHALNYGGQIFFGEQALVRFDDKVRFASTAQAHRVALPKIELPGKPVWRRSGSSNPTSSADARTKIQIFAAPTGSPTGELTLGAGNFAASYFRVLFGLDASSGVLRWVRSLPADIVGGAAASSGFVMCDANGKVWLLDSSGGDANSLSLGSKVRLCSADAGDTPVPPAPARAPLAEQIAQALASLEPDMAEAERYLVAQLGTLQDPSVTQTLIELSSSPRIPPELRSETRRLLGLRRNGTDAMLKALARHYDFISGILLPPPVGPLADALAATGERRAAPLLAKHLNDPADSAEDVAHAARALVKLAGPDEYEELRTFFALYRATADDEALVGAVLACAEALLRIGGDEARALVERAAQDPLTQADVRRGLPEVLGKPGLAQAGTAAGSAAAGSASPRD